MTSNAQNIPGDQAQKLIEAMAAHWVEHRPQFLERIEVIENSTAAALSGQLDDLSRDHARSEAHKLKGALGMFGLSRGSQIAATVERAFEQESVTESQAADIAEQIVQLRSLIENHAAQPARQPEASADVETTLSPSLSIVSSSVELIGRLKERLGWRFKISAFESIEKFRASVPQPESNIVFDARSLNPDDSFDWLPSLVSGARSVAVLATGLPLKRRVELTDHGVAMVIDPTGPFDEVVNSISEMAGGVQRKRGVLLAIDDDPAVLRAIQTIMGPHLDAINVAEDSSSAWEALEKERPDIILADYDMPGISGIDLLGAIRKDPRFATIPVLMLTGHDDPRLIDRIYAAGAEDCIQKPLTASKVTSRIFARIQRLATDERTTGAALPSSLDDAQAEFATAAAPVDFTIDIAIVDDDDIVAGLVAESAESLGYSVTKIADGEAAIEALCGDRPTVRPRLTLLDVDMPGRNGLHVLIQLASDGLTDVSHVIMLTGRSTESEVLEALKRGASDHIAKPFSLPVLMEKIQNVLGK